MGVAYFSYKSLLHVAALGEFFFLGPTFDLEHYYSESCNLIGQLEVN